MTPRQRIPYGDWQTPQPLADAVVAALVRQGLQPDAVLEPTCGRGSFLRAAQAWPGARRVGLDINPAYVAEARATGAEVSVADIFTLDWEAALGDLDGELLLLGNPPWVTSAALGRLDATNRPARGNPTGLRGLDALTGRANFDVSEWLLRRLLVAAEGRRFTLAMLVKTAVARKVLAVAGLGGALWDIDARAGFGASVDATLLVLRSDRPAGRWPHHPSLKATTPTAELGLVDGTLTADLAAFQRTAHLEGTSQPTWRSGLKHDCARVMELDRVDGGWTARGGAPVDLDPPTVHPLLKGSDVAHGRWPPRKAVIVPQHSLGEDTTALQRTAPRTWAWLDAHRAALDGRRSAIYRGRPAFSVFGVGPYTFAPWKVAVAGLYKRLRFTLVGPLDGRPVVLDDTCLFLPFQEEAAARRAQAALSSPLAADFLNARVFWDEKRPLTKAVLQRLDLEALARAAAVSPA